MGVADGAPVARAEALLAEGNALEDRGDAAAALATYDAARAACPDHPRVPLNVANALASLGRIDEAIRTLRDALAANPRHAAAQFNLGKLHLAQSRQDDAEAAFRAALALDPAMTQAGVALAGVLEAKGRVGDAEALLLRAVQERPDLALARFNLGTLYVRQERCDEAESLLKGVDSQALPPGTVSGALGELYLKMGRHTEAQRAFASALREDPAQLDPGSGLLFALNFRADTTPAEVFDEHVRIGVLIERSAGAPYRTWNVPAIANRRLRIGYVSGDLMQHPVGRFMLPVLAHHDRHNFDVHCFYNHVVADDVTRQLQYHVRNWHSIAGDDDTAVAQRIHDLGIDLLVDLSGHTTRHRLGVFARRPAPLQAAWLGYLNTTGLAAIDWRICDRHTDPEGETERFNVERLCRLPHAQWCYLPFANVPEVKHPATRDGDDVVFGSFSQRVKVTDATLDLWGRVLRELPRAALAVMDTDPAWARRSLLDRLAVRGVRADRVRLLGRESLAAYYGRIAEVDIALDTFPYNGATTTFDTLWMGTPLVALRGDRGIARGGYSILSELGDDDLVARSADEWVGANVALARNAARRATLRRTLRDRLRGSPLLDTKGFVRDLEAAYRGMWTDWCLRGR